MKRPTKEQIEAALKNADNVGTFPAPEPWDSLRIIAAAYRATRQPAQIMGRVIAYIIAASLFALACGGLVWAVEMAVRMVAG